MENNELYCFGDLPVTALMHSDVEPIDDDAVIEHAGIKGMRWGVRRYQNKDGSLTPAGKKRYNQELSKIRSAEKTLKTKQAAKAKIDKLNDRKKTLEANEEEFKRSVKARSKSEPKKDVAPDSKVTPKKKTTKDMSDDELRDAIYRMQLEKQYKILDSELHPQKVSAGKEFMSKLGKNLGDAAAEAAKNAGKSFMEKKLKEVLGVDEQKVESAYDKLKKKYDMSKLEYDMEKLKSDRDKLKKGSKTQEEADKELAAEASRLENKWKILNNTKNIKKEEARLAEEAAAAAKSEKEAAEKAKAAKKAQQEAEKAERAEKEAKRAAEKAEKEAKRAAEKAEKEAKRAAEKDSYDYEVVGEGTSHRTEKKGPIYDADFSEMYVSDVPAVIRSAGSSYANRNNYYVSDFSSTTRSLGESYVNNMLALPAPRRR